MNQLFSNKYAQMKAAGQHADVCLLNTQDGWWTRGTDFEKVQATGLWDAKVIGRDDGFVSPAQMPQVIRRLTDAGHSVALLDYWSPSLAVKPQPTLIVKLEGKVTEDWI